MRRLTTLALFLAALAPAASAQEAVPDTTPPHLYYPLAVGNEWEYANIGLLPTVAGWYTRREITRDSVYRGKRYFVEVWTHVDLYWNGWVDPRERVLRFDTTAAAVFELLDGGREWPALPGCRFDLAFQDSVRCFDESPGIGDDTFVSGRTSARIPLGRGGSVVGTGPTDSLDVMAVKAFRPLGFHATTLRYYAAPIGYAGEIGWDCSDCARNLSYARVHLDDGIHEVGSRHAVAEEEAPSSADLALQAFPNPTPGPLALTLGLAAPGIVTAEAFDALGRRVWHHETALGASRQRLDVDAEGWAPGLYVVRVTAGGATATARVVRR